MWTLIRGSSGWGLVINSDILPPLLAHCSTVLNVHRPILLALFLGGLTGSVSHCLAMCSPFVLSQLDGTRGKGRFASLLLPYHLGRITTYMLLGVLAGAAFHLMVNEAWFMVLSRLFLALAASFFLIAMLHRLPVKLPLPALPSLFPRLCSMSDVQRLANMNGAWKRYLLGVTLGFIPCGLIFAALMAVASTGSPAVGAVGMLMFGLGTMPALLIVGLAGKKIAKRFDRPYRYLTAIIMGANSAMLFVLAGR